MTWATRVAVALGAVGAFHLAGGCGAKSGLGLPDGDPRDGGFAGAPSGSGAFGGTSPGSGGAGAGAGGIGAAGGNAGAPVQDAATDVPLDVPDVCVVENEVLSRRLAEVVLVVDRSNSMNFSLDGDDDPPPGVPRRWDLMGEAFEVALTPNEDFLLVGAKMYPQQTPSNSVDELCRVQPGLDINIGKNRVGPFINLFTTTQPSGGTPTAVALDIAREALANRPDDGTPRFIVLATDGAPNCNPFAAPPNACQCTWPGGCGDPVVGPYLCLDEDDTLSAIDRAFREDEIPVYVIGISDPNPLFVDMLNRMAEAGGRALPPPAPRQYYDVQQPEDLDEALVSITNSIARCVFTVGSLLDEDVGIIALDNAEIPFDPTRQNGWDFTGPGEITLFGEACSGARELTSVVQAGTLCEE